MKTWRISKKLFVSYSLLFSILYLISTAVAVVFIATDINRSILETQAQMVQNISRSIEMYFEDMDDFSMQLLNSTSFKQAVIYDLPAAYDEGHSQGAAMQKLYVDSYEMFEKGYRVGVATKSDHYIWMGDNIIVERLERPVHTYDGYSGAGKAVIYTFDRNDYLDAIPNAQQIPVTNEATICLARSINLNNLFTNPQAMLEVHVSKSDFSRFIDSLGNSSQVGSLKIWVLGSDGKVLYGEDPLPLQPFVQDDSKELRYHSGGNIMQLKSVFGGEITVLFTIPASVYYAKLIGFIAVSVVFLVLMCGVIVFVTYHVSRQISKPVLAMSEQLENIRLGEELRADKVHTNIYELNVMAQTVFELNDKLQASLASVVSHRTAEMQARVLALQNQMQPHFLYNTLAAIAMLGEQGNSRAVGKMCTDLSQMLRYTSSEADSGVSLYEETRFLKSYVGIMQQRFPEAQVKIDIPLEMLPLRVPKLILQPLVENSFKYCARTDPRITVRGELSGEDWSLFVCDNGAGFTPEKAAEVLERCRSAVEDSRILSAKIDGMGLVNIYVRLHLYYHGDFVFDILPGQGMRIGGKRNHAGK